MKSLKNQCLFDKVARAGGTLLSIALLTAVVAPTAHAQESAIPIPDLSAIWTRAARSVTPRDFPLNARGVAMQQAIDEFQHPMYDCVPAATPHIMGDPYNFSIEQLSDRVIITYEKDAVVRTVWLDGHGHPAANGNDFSVQGHSTGRYEDDELLIETTHFAYDPSGLEDRPPMVPSSTSKRTVERYSREDDQLTVEIDVYDRLFLTEPLYFRLQFAPTDTPLVDWLPCDPEHARNALRYIPDEELKYGVR